MTETPDRWAMRVQAISQRFEYPPTPAVAGMVRARLDRRAARRARGRTAPAAALLLILLALGIVTVLAVPDLRARAFDWLRIGAVRIVDEAPESLPDTVNDPLFDPAFAVTLDEARAQVEFPVGIPAVLDDPDFVFLHPLADPVVILVWLDESGEHPTSLHLVGADNVILKYDTREETITSVGEQRAIWLANPHLFVLSAGESGRIQRTVTGGVLIWEAADQAITYRLEGDLTLEEARRIAESVREQDD